ncbi:MAG: UDP-N-acetylmuramoyl-L-alanyl-D-glutamate--2,6-diaminopimelate ligase [Rhabdochlamydiaceae bacterium]|nr:UDP-N-acetylmuramoyl-L-alanyl-D-glutamate--2,6-diaminopimelate ligase [Rhabdochlamydiaceae bacterium]
MKLKKLIKEIPAAVIKGNKEIEITGISNDTRRVAPGNLFIAKRGLTHDGAKLIPEAIAAGAVAVLTDLYDPFYPQVTQVVHPDVPMLEALLARHFYQCPDQSLFLVGITGTNGKTTTSYLVKHLLDQKTSPCGLIGSIARIIGKHAFPAPQNTPDVITNYKLFHEMVLQQCASCVMEVTSHGLHQGRVRLIEFDVAVFTNLTQDHLDYHPSMQAYAEVKASLFASLSLNAHAVVNADDPWHTLMIDVCPAQIFTYGIDAPCTLRAENIELLASGTQFDLVYQGKRAHLKIGLIGRFNVYNCLAALAVGIIRGIPFEKCVFSLSRFTAVPGRLERVENERNLNIFVDYAHTDDALKNVLETLAEFKKGRLITVFGCGGNRDPLKRPKMGAVVEELSDIAIVTSDNPRNEDPGEIIRHILQGFKHPEEAWVELEREEAIARAINAATPDDIVLIAGKGHEDYQIFSHQTIAFDDREVAKRLGSCTFSPSPSLSK